MARVKQIARKNGAASKSARKNLTIVKDTLPAPHRWRPGTVAIRKIKKYQKSTELLLRKLPFSRLVREICADIEPGPKYRFTKSAFAALQHMSEAYMVGVFQDCQDYALHARRVTIDIPDMKLTIEKRTRTIEERNLDNCAVVYKRPYMPTAPRRRKKLADPKKTADPKKKKEEKPKKKEEKPKKKEEEKPKEKEEEEKEEEEEEMEEEEKEEEETEEGRTEEYDEEGSMTDDDMPNLFA
jgi:histone H3